VAGEVSLVRREKTLVRFCDVDMPDKSGEKYVVELVAKTQLFRHLTAADQEICAGKFREMRFDKGQIIFARGDPGTHLYVVAEGQVRLAIGTVDGRELSFQVATTGDLIGEIAVLDGGSRSAEATALTAVVAYVLERNAFRDLWSAHPAISNAVITFLCWRLRDASDRLEGVALYPMEVRLARFLLVALGDREMPPGRRVPLELGFSQSELAMLLGASRPKINAALGVLETAGAIGRTSDRLFCDRAKLSQIAHRGER
jgi:CRP/FNR family transcriptional regulator, cyclic AMP receptor protein